MGIFMIKDYQTYLGQQIINRYWYNSGLDSPAWDDVATAFLTQVITAVRELQAGGLTHTSIEVTDMENPANFGSFPHATGGGASGEVMPSFVTARFSLIRSDRTWRSGRKAIGGMTELTVTGNEISGNYSAEVTAIENALGADIVTTESETLTPCLVRLDASGAVDEFMEILGAQFTGIGTQNSRKKGSGN